MNVQPLRDCIVVSKEADKESTRNGIILVSQSKVVTTGKVLAVGTGKVTDTGAIVPLEVKVGDEVVFHNSVTTELQSDDGAVLLLREDNLLAVIK